MISDWLAGDLLAAALSWRWVLQIALLSLGLALASRFAYADDPLSRRGLGMAAVLLLAVAPLVLLLWQPRWQVGVVDVPQLPVPPDVPTAMASAWLLLALGGVALLSWRLLLMRRALVALPHCPDTAVLAQARRLCSRLRMPVPLIVVGDQCCASSLGHPLIVISHDFSSWSPAAQRAALAHELVHLRRRDDRWLLALDVLQRCYLFCPWLHGLRVRLLQAIEESCDDAAALLLGTRRGYFNGLAHAVLGPTSVSRTSYVSYAAAGSLTQRLRRLVAVPSWHEVQAGSLLAGLTIGSVTLLLVTTFEFVAVTTPAVSATTGIPASTRVALVGAAQAAATTDIAAASNVVPQITVVPGGSRSLRPTHRPRVIYPGEALLRRVEGAVLVRYQVAGDGSVVRARVVRSSPAEVFDRAAMRAAQQTRYRPSGHSSQRPVETLYRFSLRPIAL